MKKNLRLPVLAVLLAAVTLVSCKKDDNNGMSTFNVRMTDAPDAYDAVNIDIREVRVKFSDDDNDNDGWLSLNPVPGIYNLLAFQNGVDTLIGSATFPSGQHLNQIRLVLGPNNTIVDNGVTYPLVIPSGSESGLKIKFNHMMNAALETLVIDFDAALSVKKEGSGDYKLRPVIRIK